MCPRRWCRGFGCSATGRSDKTDPNDALSVAIAALRAPALREVRAADHAEILRLLAKRNIDIGNQRTRVVCRLHNVLMELAAGGIAKELNASDAIRLLERIDPATPVEQARHDLAVELLADVQRLDAQLKESHRRIRVAVQGLRDTTLTDIFGIGPVIACYLIGFTGDIRRFAGRDQYAAYNGTAPVERSSGGRVVHRLSQRGNRRLNHALHLAAICQIRQTHSDGRAVLRTQSRRRQDQERSPARVETTDQQRRLSPTPRRRRPIAAAREGNPGTSLSSSVTGSHPEHRLFGLSHSRTNTTVRRHPTRFSRRAPNTLANNPLTQRGFGRGRSRPEGGDDGWRRAPPYIGRRGYIEDGGRCQTPPPTSGRGWVMLERVGDADAQRTATTESIRQ